MLTLPDQLDIASCTPALINLALWDLLQSKGITKVDYLVFNWTSVYDKSACSKRDTPHYINFYLHSKYVRGHVYLHMCVKFKLSCTVDGT